MQPPREIDIRPPAAAFAVAIVLSAALGSLLTVLFAAPSRSRATPGLAELSARVDVIQDEVAAIRTDFRLTPRIGSPAPQ